MVSGEERVRFGNPDILVETSKWKYNWVALLRSAKGALTELRYSHHHDEYCGCDRKAICSKQRAINELESAIDALEKE
jgi:hypothetical protein